MTPNSHLPAFTVLEALRCATARLQRRAAAAHCSGDTRRRAAPALLLRRAVEACGGGVLLLLPPRVLAPQRSAQLQLPRRRGCSPTPRRRHGASRRWPHVTGRAGAALMMRRTEATVLLLTILQLTNP